MPPFDHVLDGLRSYVPERCEPDDFEEFWARTVAEARGNRSVTRFDKIDAHLRTVDSYDVRFGGFAGQEVRAWLLVPRPRVARLPCVITYIGYGGGRGTPLDWLTWASLGYANLVMDTRGQGSGWLHGETADAGIDGAPQYPGFLTRGILDPETYYYRRLIADGTLAVEAAREHAAVDPDRIIVSGRSQGGAIALAVCGHLGSDVAAGLIDVPLLNDVRHALELAEGDLYAEIARYLHTRPADEDRVHRTLSYVDGTNFAVRAKSPALFSVGLADRVSPPSTVFAAHNVYGGPKEISVWRYSGHDTPTNLQVINQLSFLERIGLASPSPALHNFGAG